MSAVALRHALAQLGLEVSVGEIGKVAVLTPTGGDESLSLDARRRGEIVALGRAHGFANVCLEIAGTNAAVPGP